MNGLYFIHDSNRCKCVLVNRSSLCQHLSNKRDRDECVAHRLANRFLTSFKFQLAQNKDKLGGRPLSYDCINHRLIPGRWSSWAVSSRPTAAKTDTIEQCKKSTAISPRPTSAKTVILDQCNKKTLLIRTGDQD